jgi:uncharacterized protein (TIRG00374 family)
LGTSRFRRKPSWPSCAWGRSKIITGDAQRPAPRAHKDWQGLLPGLAISLVSLAILFYFADFQQFVIALRLADYRRVLLGLLMTLLWLVVRSFVWRTLLQDKATIGQVFISLNEGYLLNNVLPFRLGEVGRAYLLGRKAGLDFWIVLSTVVLERALDLLFAAGLLLCTLPFVVGASWARQAAFAAGSLVVLGLAVLWLLARNQDWALARFERLAARWPALGRFGERALPAFFSGLAVLTDGARFVRAVGWMVLNWAVALGQYYLLMTAFFPRAVFLWAAFSLGVGALGLAAPSSPGSIGVMELSLVGALAVFGLNPSISLAFALSSHLLQYLTTGLIGAYGLARDGESLVDLYRKLRSGVKDSTTKDVRG